jgi:hypothetical protein
MLLATFTTTELYCRLHLGLGNPPLSIADPKIEYLFAPNQHLRRFGHQIDYNSWSMRSGDFPIQKSRPNEVRVMVFGDSVVNGGALTDQGDIATSLLQSQLSVKLSRPVVVGNISAGSWGPPNMLAYARRFGFFQADVVVLVFSSHDYADAPTFEPTVGVSPDFPDHRPWCATWEAITRYLPRYLSKKSPMDAVPEVASRKDIEDALGAVRDLIQLARQSGAKVILGQHLEVGELPPAHAKEGHEAIAMTARAAEVEPFDIEGTGVSSDVYRDNIHPNQAGQALIATRLLTAVLAALDKPR